MTKGSGNENTCFWMGLMILRAHYTKSEGYRGNLEVSARSAPAYGGIRGIEDRSGWPCRRYEFK